VRIPRALGETRMTARFQASKVMSATLTRRIGWSKRVKAANAAGAAQVCAKVLRAYRTVFSFTLLMLVRRRS